MKKTFRTLTGREIPQDIGLEATLDRANAIPYNVTIPTLFQYLDSLDLESRVDAQSDLSKAFRDWFKIHIEPYPDLKRLLVPENHRSLSPDEIKNEVIQTFDRVLHMRSVVSNLADAAEKFRTLEEEGQAETGVVYFPLDTRVLVTVGDRHSGIPDGVIRVEAPPFLQVFEGLQIAKIRRCERANCRKVFWQNRKDKTTCSRRCSTALSVSEHRNRKSGGKR